MGVAAWAGYPLLSPNGDVLGSFCVIDTAAHRWTDRDIKILATLAQAAASEIALRTALADAQAGRRELEQAVRAAREAPQRLGQLNARSATTGHGIAESATERSDLEP